MKVNGNMTKNMVKAHLNMLMDLNTSVNGRTTKNMDLAHLFSLTDPNKSVNLFRTFLNKTALQLKLMELI